jgi:acyl carrier protein
MDRTELEQQILAIVREQKTLPDGVNLQMPLTEAGIDSLDALNILFAVEEQYNIHVPDDRARNLRNLDDIVTAVQELTAQ